MAETVIGAVQPFAEPLEPAGTRTDEESCDGAQFDALFQKHYPRTVAMVGRLTGDRGQAEEIAADVFAKLAQRRGILGDGAGVVAWLYRVAMNAGLDAARSNARRRRREATADAEQLRTPTAGALEEMLREERRARVREILGALKARDSQLLLLRSSGLSYRELAQTMGVQATSVGTLLARAEAEFERRYRARFGDDL
ncbi:MAG TPA: sigma-70 family RNA polymerase sigma factor [Bryobacteraceae bacterium]|nr:sigma-70 family RNA polymerase sigma factor [Bryobacteraceae bacterium]